MSHMGFAGPWVACATRGALTGMASCTRKPEPNVPCRRFQRFVLEKFGHVRNWATLKFWNMHAYEKCPAAVASAVYTDTASQEATHADLKRQGRFTNNRPDAVDAQVC